MREVKLYSFVLTLLLVISISPGTGTTSIISNQSILLFEGYNSLQDFNNPVAWEPFRTIYADQGNNMKISTNIQQDLDTDVDILLLAEMRGTMSSSDVTHIQNWLTQGDKIIWFGGSSDFADNFDADDTYNPILSSIGSQLRVDPSAIRDDYYNSEIFYRVLAQTPGSSPFAQQVTADVDQALFHGPAPIYAFDEGTKLDLRYYNPPEIEVIFSTSDLSISEEQAPDEIDGFYPYLPETGYYPVMVVEQMESNMIIVSGESTFTDLHNQYSYQTEQSIPHQGRILTDSLLWHLTYDISNFGINTIAGNDISLQLDKSTFLTFETVTQAGTTDVYTTEDNPQPDLSFSFEGDYIDITSSAEFTGTIEICLNYDDTDMTDESSLNFLHLVDSEWVDITSSLDTDNNIICGVTDSFSWFAIAHYLNIEEQYDVVVELVHNMYLDGVINKGQRNSMVSILINSVKSYTNENYISAINQLEALVDYVEALSRKKLDPNDVVLLRTYLDQLIQNIVSI